MFIDRVKMKVKAGNGGNGLVAFRREAHVPLGGPFGGDGGKGGSIIFEVDTNKSTLLDLRYNKKLIAQNGGPGKTKKMHGADGDDIIVRVPQGTMIKDAESGALIADLVNVGQSTVIAKGGRGGRGNWHFASSRDSAPEYAEQGGLGETKEIQIELKLLADVGLVGFPSVGKSTLLSVVSEAKPEIGDYHFTTLVPNLGVVKVPDGRSFVMADLPGLIEGASQGKGLGHEFLRHIERCRVLLHVVDMGSNDGRDPLEDYRIINEELKAYEMRLSERPQIVLANKMDLDNAEENLERFKKEYPEVKVYPTITLIHEGLDAVLYALADLLAVTPEFPLFDETNTEERVLYKFAPKDKGYNIVKMGNHMWRLEGIRVIRLFESINFEDETDVYRFGNMLKEMGVDADLREAGAEDGDTILIKEYEMQFVD